MVPHDGRMKPVAILFSRYRAFKDEGRLQLAPLTVVIGKNGGGKSVLMRLPALLAGGLADIGAMPLDLNAGGILHAARFEDLVHQRSAQPFMLGAEGLAADGSVWAFRTTMRHVVESYSLAIEKFELLHNGELELEVSADSPEDVGKPCGSFKVWNPESSDVVKECQWQGLFPVELPGRPDDEEKLTRVREQFVQAFASPSYLGPFRAETGASSRVPRQGTKTLGSRGENALEILGDNTLRGDGKLADAVAEWFSDSLGNATVMTTEGGIPRLMVRDAARNLDVELTETGAGFSQVLPVAVQALGRVAGVIESPISVVEQPELHLHPGVHGDVADLIATQAKAMPDVPYLVETHSEQFITRLRRRVAEGDIEPQSIQIISVWHRATLADDEEAMRVIEIDKFGNTSSWPMGVFDEAFDDLVHIRQAAALSGQ